jgi:hypothetical protein
VGSWWHTGRSRPHRMFQSDGQQVWLTIQRLFGIPFMGTIVDIQDV